ncbi:diguanylate cyclase domain-containing protein [Sphingomonas sp.]|uniref:diguanylate cyclase domain-containing protein n=1 Tax=Sphingomonas sp. TaxID=28214 RepID=UPI003F8096CF
MPTGRQRSFRRFFREAPLPAPIHREFIDMLFGMWLPILGMGAVTVVVAALAAREWRDSVIATLAAAAVLVTAARLITIRAYHRARPVADIALRRWETRYAIGNYAFGLLLGLLNVYVLTYHFPLLHLIAVSLVFGFGAGIVARISVRPLICVISLLLATVPTVAALAVHALEPSKLPLHGELFAVEACLVAMIATLSLQTVAHLYRSAVQHLTAEHDMALLAKFDPLTGLANRLALRERFQASSAIADEMGDRLALHFIDLDGFKAVNDGLGHLAGDAVLIEVARRLAALVRAEDTVARLGGDEFVVLQTRVQHEDEAGMLARRVIRQLSLPYEADGHPARISASVGIAMMPDFGRALEDLISCADAALYRCKSSGKGKHHFCTSGDLMTMEQAVA